MNTSNINCLATIEAELGDVYRAYAVNVPQFIPRLGQIIKKVILKNWRNNSSNFNQQHL